jgi:hypothetical protein
MDHDQRFKHLLQTFFGDFLQLLFPAWAARFDLTRVAWLSQELFLDPPQGERRYLDLVAELPTREAVPALRPDEASSWLALVHVEPSAGEAVAPLRPRMYDYYRELRERHRRPVLPIALLLNVGLDGLGTQVYTEQFWELEALRFTFFYVGLPALDAATYVQGDNWLGVALSALMRIPADHRARLKAEALRRLVGSPLPDQQRFLLGECVQAYLPLEGPQLQAFEHLLLTPAYLEVKNVQLTWAEEGEIRGQRRLIRAQLEIRFGVLSPQVQERLDRWPADRLEELAKAFVQAQSLKDLGLED